MGLHPPPDAAHFVAPPVPVAVSTWVSAGVLVAALVKLMPSDENPLLAVLVPELVVLMNCWFAENLLLASVTTTSVGKDASGNNTFNPRLPLASLPTDVVVTDANNKFSANQQFINTTNSGTSTASNGFSSDGINFTKAATNTPADTQVLTATGTGGATKWAASGGGWSPMSLLTGQKIIYEPFSGSLSASSSIGLNQWISGTAGSGAGIGSNPALANHYGIWSMGVAASSGSAVALAMVILVTPHCTTFTSPAPPNTI